MIGTIFGLEVVLVIVNGTNRCAMIENTTATLIAERMKSSEENAMKEMIVLEEENSLPFGQLRGTLQAHHLRPSLLVPLLRLQSI